MKKIISIILAIIAIFAMSVNSFAFTAVSKPEAPKDPENYVSVVITLEEITSKDKLDVFYAITNDEGLDEDSVIKGRTATFKVEIYNNMEEYVKIADVVAGLKISATDISEDKNVLPIYKSDWAKDTKLNNTINADDYIEGDKGLTYSVKIITDDLVRFDITLGGETKEIKLLGNSVAFMLIEDEETTTPDTEATPDTPAVDEDTKEDESETTPPAEDKTDAEDDAETVDPTPDTIIPSDKDEIPEDDYVAPDVEVEIPDTGAAAPVGAIGTLIGSAVAAVIAKKKREN